MKNFKFIICILFVLVILLISFLGYKIYNAKVGKNLVISSVYLDDNDNISINLVRIFKLDSHGKCINTKFVIAGKNTDLLTDIDENMLKGYDTENNLTNSTLNDSILYIDNNEFNGLMEEEIKNKLYNKYVEEGKSNTKYNVNVSISEF